MKKIISYTEGDWETDFVLIDGVYSILSRNKKSKVSDNHVFDDETFGEGRGSKFGIELVRGLVNDLLDNQLNNNSEQIIKEKNDG